MTDQRGIKIVFTPELLRGMADLGITITIDRTDGEVSWTRKKDDQ